MSARQVRRFSVDSGLVLQLGEQLIRDDVQAIMELVKNSYDADATSVRLIIDSNNHYPGETEPGYIVVQDDGFGMSEDSVTRGWLMISNSLKREMKKLGQVTGRGRTPLGDKGLGRLSAQRLGRRLRIETTADGGEETIVMSIDWSLFGQSRPLETIPVEYEAVPRLGRKAGTRLVVTGLVDVGRWRDLSPERLRARLAEIVSPFESIEKFRLRCRFNGRRIDPGVVAKNVRNAAHLRYTVTFDGSELRAEGFFRPEYIKANLKEDEQLLFAETVEVDRGERFIRFLKERRRKDEGALLHNLRNVEEGPWMFRCTLRRSLDEVPGLRVDPDGKPYNPGPFSAEVDGFNLGIETAREFRREFDVFSRASEFKRFVSDMAGIRVYRDGFAIRVDRDWLGLGQQWSKGTSWYTLKPSNTLGYVAISARGNPCLEETTDREGFIANAYYDTFFELLQAFLKFSSESQEQLRRGWNDFKASVHVKNARLEVASPSAASAKVAEGLDQLETFQSAVTSSVEELREAVRTAEAAPPALFVDRSEASKPVVNAIEGSVRKLEQAMAALGSIEQRRSSLKLLSTEVERLRETLAETYELVSLGLTAEALSHELSNISDRLAAITDTVEAHLEENQIDDTGVRLYVERVRDSLTALDKQLGHLDPSLRYVRELKFDINLNAFLSEISDFYAIRFSGKPLALNVSASEFPFIVRMNKGKLIQVVDNLILNSEYWVKEEIAAKRIDKGVITLQAEFPYLIVSDNGRGVDPEYERSVFEPFVTAKPPGKGRGLGLFVVSQLLDADGCSISLLDDRNQHGRRYRFRVDLSGAMIP